MKQKRQFAALAAALAVTGALVGATAAANGDEKDPLVTLSYLDKVVIPQVVSQVEDNMLLRQKELDKSFTDKVNQYKAEAQGSQGGGTGQSAAFTLVTMEKNQVLKLDLGCELMLRVGTAKVNAPEDPALIDMTDGKTLGMGAELVKNHLYMASIPGRTVTATGGTVKLMVRGGYSLS